MAHGAGVCTRMIAHYLAEIGYCAKTVFPDAIRLSCSSSDRLPSGQELTKSNQEGTKTKRCVRAACTGSASRELSPGYRRWQGLSILFRGGRFLITATLIVLEVIYPKNRSKLEHNIRSLFYFWKFCQILNRMNRLPVSRKRTTKSNVPITVARKMKTLERKQFLHNDSISTTDTKQTVSITSRQFLYFLLTLHCYLFPSIRHKRIHKSVHSYVKTRIQNLVLKLLNPSIPRTLFPLSYKILRVTVTGTVTVTGPSIAR